MSELGPNLVLAGGLSGGVLLASALVWRFEPLHRPQVRRGLYLLGVYLAVFVAETIADAAGASAGVASFLHHTVQLLALATAIKVGGLFVFDLALPRAGLALSTFVEDLVLGAGYVVAFLITLRGAGVELSGLVTTSAVVTGILALSFQATLGNVVGGLALQLDSSIRTGDWIQLPDGRQGRVREIRWRHTVVETRDWDTIVVPNATLLNANIVILGKRAGEPLQHRMWVHFHVDFRHRPSRVCEVVVEALRASPIVGVAANPPPNVLCLDLGNQHRDSVALYVAWYWLTDLARDEPTSSIVRARVYAALERAGIPLAIPARQVFLEENDDARRARKAAEEHARRLGALAAVELFSPLHDDERDRLADALQRMPFEAGETITKQGSRDQDLYVLTEGHAEIWVEQDGESRRVVEISAPGFFGEMSLMTGEPRAATVVARTRAVCYRLQSEPFREVLAAREEIAAELSSLLALRKVQLEAARENLDSTRREARVSEERLAFLGAIKSLFKLGR